MKIRKKVHLRRRKIIRKLPRRLVKSRKGKPINPVLPTGWVQEAYTAGAGEGSRHQEWNGQDFKQHLNYLWYRWASVKIPSRFDWSLYQKAALQFIEGYCTTAGLFPRSDWVLVPTNKSIAAIVTVMNEEKTILGIVEQLHRLPLNEMIFVVNGTTDQSFPMIRSFSSSMVVHYPEPLGHDVGRSVGAKLSQSDILLFLDGDFPVLAEHLLPFLFSIERGSDIALNNITPFMRRFHERDGVTVVKEFLNKALGRADLQANSLTAIPHAMSRSAVELIGYSNLITPPKAQTIAILNGLTITAPTSVDVIASNKIRSSNAGVYNPVSELIIGDHIEALQIAMQLRGERLHFPDAIRQRASLEVV